MVKILQTLILLLSFNILNAGCGACQINNKVKPSEESSAFITESSYNGQINGFVIASCNKCNLGKSGNKKCSMGIKLNNKAYDVKGYEHSHDNAHNHDGICNALRIAHVSGKIKGNRFIADSFQLIDSPNN